MRWMTMIQKVGAHPPAVTVTVAVAAAAAAAALHLVVNQLVETKNHSAKNQFKPKN